MTAVAELTPGQRLEAGYGLIPAEQAALARCESIISAGAETAVQVAMALEEIRASRLYRGAYKTFEAYCRDRWGRSARHANRQIIAARVAGIITAMDEAAAIMGPDGPALAESQARELTPLRDNPAAVRQVWARAVSAADGKQPTAAIVRQARQEYQQEQAERRQARQDKGAGRRQQELAAYIGEHGHAPDYMELESELSYLRRRARAAIAKITADDFDYTADERASLAAAVAALLGILAPAQEMLIR